MQSYFMFPKQIQHDNSWTNEICLRNSIHLELAHEIRCFHTCKRSPTVLQAASLWWACWGIVLWWHGANTYRHTVSLHSTKTANRAVKGDCQWPLKNHGNSHQSHEPKIYYNTGNHNLHVDQPITKEWCQQRSCDVSYHTASPCATRLRLCNSLSYVCLAAQRKTDNSTLTGFQRIKLARTNVLGRWIQKLCGDSPV